jgi:Protein of unknown function (DUF664)
MATEREALMSCLDMQRKGVVRIVEGMPEDALRAAVLPSGWTSLGMLQHLTVNERYWFRWGVAGEAVPGVEVVDGRCQVVLEDQPDPDNEWLVPDHLSAEAVIARYRAEVAKANAAIAEARVDAPPRNRDEWWAQFGGVDVRWIILHMIEETAQHAGHLDIVRELIEAGIAPSAARSAD